MGSLELKIGMCRTGKGRQSRGVGCGEGYLPPRPSPADARDLEASGPVRAHYLHYYCQVDSAGFSVNR